MAYYSSFAIVLALCISFQSAIHVQGDSSLIESTCKVTNYYDLCISSLKSDLTSLNADANGLAIIMVRVAMANATATNTYLSSQVLSATNDTLMKKLIKDCAKKYSYAIEALQASLQDLDAELYDYAYINVMAAADYPNVCHNSFRRSPGVAYPHELAAREDGLKHICEVALGIIDSLGR
nr:cell wall / vacuolar inhibitor of fructosidase 2 [Coffea arabica]